MDDLDQALADAWWRVWRRCEENPGEALKRWRRCREGAFARPVRAWCLAVRASDTRLTSDNGFAVHEEMFEDRQPHPVFLTGAGLRAVCGPVSIPWPGVPLQEAAARLGRSREALRRWLPVRPGRSRAEIAARGVETRGTYSDPDAVFDVKYVYARPYGHTGHRVPIVWTRTGCALDPGASPGDALIRSRARRRRGWGWTAWPRRGACRGR